MSSTGTGGNTDAPPVLEVRGVSAGYDGLTVLRDVSLAVRPGELVAWWARTGPVSRRCSRWSRESCDHPAVRC